MISAEKHNIVAQLKIKKMSARGAVDAHDQLAVEQPLEIQLKYGSAGQTVQKSISVTMRTPGNDKELAVGFLFTENIIQGTNQVASVKNGPGDENTVLVSLHENHVPRLQKTERNFYTTSSCGVCGKSSIEAIRTVSAYNDQKDNISLKSDLFYGLQDLLRQQQAIFQSTGGLHASALFDLNGRLIMVREDVGRHNALDKVIGTAFLEDLLPLNNSILLLSGRASFELIQKAGMAGIKVVAAVGAPSSLAVEMAEDSGITLIGFLRDERFNIYSGFQRITL